MDIRELYTDLIQELARTPKHRGTVSRVDLEGTAGNPSCGDKCSYQITLENGTVSEIRFSADGCIIAKAAAELLAELVQGKAVMDARATTPEKLLEELGGMIDLRRDCALLPLKTLRQAIPEDFKG